MKAGQNPKEEKKPSDVQENDQKYPLSIPAGSSPRE